MIVKASKLKVLIYRAFRYFVLVNSFLFIGKFILKRSMDNFFSADFLLTTALMCLAVSLVTMKRVHDRFDLTLNSHFISGPNYWGIRKVFIKLDDLLVSSSTGDSPRYNTQLLHSLSNTPIKITPYFYDKEKLKNFVEEVTNIQHNFEDLGGEK